MNRLNTSTSPYLLQHADNPVDWWPWSDEAFEEARRRDVPVLSCVPEKLGSKVSFQPAGTVSSAAAGFAPLAATVFLAEDFALAEALGEDVAE